MDNYNGFPVNYQPYQWYYQPSTTTPVVYNTRLQQPVVAPSYQQSQQQNGQMIWVQGESGAKSYVLPNGTTVPLWDSENQTIYIKTVDTNGRPSMTILDYTERGNKDSDTKEQQNIEYATKEQIDSLNSQFAAINEKLSQLGIYATKDQFNYLNGGLDDLNNHINDLGTQIEDIENRIMSFGKPQQNNSNNRRGNNKS